MNQVETKMGKEAGVLSDIRDRIYENISDMGEIVGDINDLVDKIHSSPEELKSNTDSKPVEKSTTLYTDFYSTNIRLENLKDYLRNIKSKLNKIV